MKKIIGFIIVMMMCVVGTAFANAAEMNYTDGTLTINGLNGSADLLHASYTDGVLDSTEILNVSDGTYNINAKNGDKLFLWDNTNTMKPLSGNIIVGEKIKVKILKKILKGKFLLCIFRLKVIQKELQIILHRKPVQIYLNLYRKIRTQVLI